MDVATCEPGDTALTGLQACTQACFLVQWSSAPHLHWWFPSSESTSFGAALKANGMVWTKALCQADSDGDGLSNGDELGNMIRVVRGNEATRPHPT